MRLVIPKGKGFTPGKPFEVEVKGKGKMMAEMKSKEKHHKKSLFGLFGGSSKDEGLLFVDDEVYIGEGSTIPAGTVIQGGKLERIS